MGKEITPRSTDYSQWYIDIVKKADLAENSDVRGCIIIKPYGFSIWEKMQQNLDALFKETGHVNAYFPLFVPKTMFEAEEKNAEGFSKECAVVTHYRLKNDPHEPGKLIVDEKAKLEEELVVRPTSEAIIWNTYKKWIHSYRDLPLLINQWANVVRWEMRPRLFLRTTEFLWQEGHTAHATAQEAIDETRCILDVYTNFAEKYLALPVYRGVKTEAEKFPGAIDTYCIEALMQDGKALQAGTSHFLGQNFAKAFNVQFTNSEGRLDWVWGTSWGVSTRLMGALVMAHSDDNGLILPPKLAPIHVVIIPIFKNDREKQEISQRADRLMKNLSKQGLSVKYDDRPTYTPGFKFAEYELKGIPIRIAIGPRDLANETVELVRRDTFEKKTIPIQEVEKMIHPLLDSIQSTLYQRALAFRSANTHEVNSYAEFKKKLGQEGGFLLAHWDGTSQTEAAIKEETKATIRCIPLQGDKDPGKCIFSNQPSNQRVLFARAY